MKLYHVTNNSASHIALSDIPVVEYVELYNDLKERMSQRRYHIGHYFATEIENGLKFFLILLDDTTSEVLVTSFVPDYYSEGLASLTALHPAFHPFEREIHVCHSIATLGSSPCASATTVATKPQQWIVTHSTLLREMSSTR